MLQTQTVEPGTLSILKQLMAIPELQSFSLVGGTALALKYGHRTSVDLDLFSTENFEHQMVIDVLRREFGTSFVHESDFAKWGVFCVIGGVKVDLVYYPHKQLYPAEVREDIRMYDDRDLIAMKIQAILGRGKKKDFWDICELLQHYSLSEAVDFHIDKYTNQMLLISIPQALIYFEDAEKSDEPVSFKGQTWLKIKNDIKKTVRDFLL
ncbi:MAG: nucleotidyl transferase AbiEii/AbiGii toxin family protein [Prevotellaceae bacterium]|jgi:predicted nucleotidyltransferase component of viral defense system|nr:nucleotidyl transferase AbiEii/AbiGii toxin family protein [Prevotellaceae bacterium]